MSKATVKCPSCGKQVPAAMRYCGWCGFDMKVGASKRVDSLPRPEEKKQSPQPMQQPPQEPVQPVVPKQPAQPPKATKVQKPNPVQEPVPKQKAVNPNRMAAAAAPASAKKKSGKITAILAALAVIVLVIVILAVIFRFQNSPTKAPSISEDFNNVHVVDANETASPNPEDTAEPDATDAPTGATDAPAPVDDETGTDANTDEIEKVDDIVYVTGSGVNLRTGPGTTYDVIGSLARGTELKRTGTTNGWSRVLYNGETCYISSALISTEAPEVTEDPAPEGEEKNTVVVIAKANIRTGPGTGYKSLGVLDVGTELECTGTSGKWTIVTYNGEEGYIFNTLVAGKGEKGTVTVIAKANIRSGAGTDYDILGVVNVGDVLPMNDHTSSNWFEVEFDGKTGYIAGNMVKAN